MDESSEEEDGSFRVSDFLVSVREEENQEEMFDDADEDEEESEEEEESDDKAEEDEDDEDEKEDEEPAPVEQAPGADLLNGLSKKLKEQVRKEAGEDELEFDDPEAPDKEEAQLDDDVLLPPHFLAGKADKLRRRSTAITMRTKQRLEKLKSGKYKPGKYDLGRDLEGKLKEQEIIAEALLEWKLECHDKIQKYKEKIKKARAGYRRRYDKHQKKIEIHLRKNNQAAFMNAFSPKEYHRAMERIAEKKKKPLEKITQVIEQYDFYFKNIVMNELVRDQMQDPKQNLRSILQLNFELKQVK